MAQTPLSENNRVGDLIRHEYGDQRYTRVAALVYNNTGGSVTLSNPMGTPVKPHASITGAYKLVLSTDEAAVTGLMLTSKPVTIANGGSIKVAILVRGPAIIDPAIIPADSAAVAYVAATLKTALQAFNPPILVHDEPSVIATQTT